MKRDMELIRDLLLKIEGGQRSFEVLSPKSASILCIEQEEPLTKEKADQLEYHLGLLDDAGYLKEFERASGGVVYVSGLTMSGHDFLDSIRDPDVWHKTKQATTATGSWTLGILKDLATAYAKAKIQEVTGVTF